MNSIESLKTLAFKDGIFNIVNIADCKSHIKSYSNMYEDIILFSLLQGKSKGFYIDIGANDPTLFSNTKLFYDMGWNGINIEPDIDLIGEFLIERPRDLNLNYAVSDKSGDIVTFYKIGPNDSDGRSRQSTIIDEIKDYRLNNSIPEEVLKIWNPGLKKNIYNLKNIGRREIKRECKISTITLDKVFEIVGDKEIDFIDIDVEGAECLVIKGANLKKYRPKLIMIEDSKNMIKKPKEDVFLIIEKSGYTLLAKDSIGLNRFYVRNEDYKVYKDNLLSLYMPNFIQQINNLALNPKYSEYIKYVRKIEDIINLSE